MIMPKNGKGVDEEPLPVPVTAVWGAMIGSGTATVSSVISYAASSPLTNSLGTQPKGLVLPVASPHTHPGSPSSSKTAVALS